MRAIDTNEEELMLDLKSAIYDSGIIITTSSNESYEKSLLNLDCSIENDVLHHTINPWGDNSIKMLMYKYKIDLKWINDKECYVYYCEDYFMENMDYRRIYDNYDEMTLDLKRLLINKPYQVWSLNDVDFFTTARKFWFGDNQGVMLMVHNEDNECTCLDDCLHELINEFMNNYGLKREYIENNLLGFSKKI